MELKKRKFAAEQIIKENLSISSIYTSQLIRAIHTAKILVQKLNYPFSKLKYDWRLNERHYGAYKVLINLKQQQNLEKKSFNLEKKF